MLVIAAIIAVKVIAYPCSYILAAARANQLKKKVWQAGLPHSGDLREGDL